MPLELNACNSFMKSSMSMVRALFSRKLIESRTSSTIDFTLKSAGTAWLFREHWIL